MSLLSPLAVIAYPDINPFALGPIEMFGTELGIRWYSLAYIAGLLFGWWYIRRITTKPGAPMAPSHVDDFLTWAIIGVIAGGRLGYVLFYNLPAYVENPIAIFRLWDGGMSFHGGALGVVLALILFCRKHKLDLMRVGDLIAIVTPVGLFTGRLANFINGELWGRPTDVPWAMVFPSDPLGLPRHPSQLYEAFGEGIVLFLLLQLLYHKTPLAKRAPGFIAGTFFAGYGLVRILVEFVREPDAHLGLMAGISRGQMLSVPMFLLAAWLMYMGIKRARSGN
ncbi:prolipoprotein diacylglyceryl transferase [Kordiimonas gwangyangensis]|uniref:prolipoprotein diacylglyceryl transferase n=1 Tax=Kordiimonas gwangyangensis TaxID=288022 RepID=UPI0003808943|nr:prolipoprotein diacylglyceryl transferase [Kordiimonas gwangyangensis]